MYVAERNSVLEGYVAKSLNFSQVTAPCLNGRCNLYSADFARSTGCRREKLGMLS